jgi:putative membrane protein
MHAVALWAWHAPAPYQAAVQNEGVHFLEHACFLGSAVVFWWSLTHGRHGRLGYGAGVLYVFSTGVHSSVLGALMTFSNRSWYPIYDARAAAQGWTPLVDQQLAGLLMWVPAGLVFIVVGLALFAAWLGESERRVAFGRADTLAHASTAGDDR